MKLSVLVPTYRRTKDLAHCLDALKQQTRPADEVLLTVQAVDNETWQFLDTFDPRSLPLRTITVAVPGQVAALNTGLEAAKGDIVAITDDDAIPHSDWLERIEAHFIADEKVGGVGGRDWLYFGSTLQTGERMTVGKIQWFGRVIGNHHLGMGEPREVDVLKGANMSYRMAAVEDLRFDNRLKGQGAQVHNDLNFSISVKHKGWNLIYDPAVAVDHYPGERFDEDVRYQFSSLAKVNAAYNEALTLLCYLPHHQKIIYLVWSVLVGTSTYPGVIQYLRLLFLNKPHTFALCKASMQGKAEAYQTWLKSRYLSIISE